MLQEVGPKGLRKGDLVMWAGAPVLVKGISSTGAPEKECFVHTDDEQVHDFPLREGKTVLVFRWDQR